MRMYDIIEKKRDKQELSKEEIDFFVNGYSKGDIPDYQMSALLMAIYLNNFFSHKSYKTLNNPISSTNKSAI